MVRGGGVQRKSISLDRSLPVKLACQGCRLTHQKCDGSLPICLRCKKEHRPCDYTPCRRGRVVAHLHTKPSTATLSTYAVANAAPDVQKALLPFSTESSAQDTFAWRQNSQDSQSCEITSTSITGRYEFAPRALKPYYTLAFYEFFWPAHPFLPPFKHLEGHLSESEGPELTAAINLIGYKYTGYHHGQTAAADFEQGLHDFPMNGFSVQALLLLAVYYHMINEKENAVISLHQAVRIALGIGLDRRNFAIDQGRGIPSIEESWRRTWWELYVLDVMFAALNQASDIQLKDCSMEVLLPCTEETYQTEDALPEPQNLTEFDARFFMDDAIEYSSFSYRIAAARALAKIVAVSCTSATTSTSSIRDAELEMENLRLHLPSSMQTYVKSGGGIDEVAFQAHMIMYAGTIYLHRPRSLLASSNPDHTIACAPNDSPAHSCPAYHHTGKIIEAADEICRMISASSSLLVHTPFFICGMAMQAVVHLGLYRLPHLSHSRTLTEQQIKMSIGALRKFSQVWEMAEVVRQDVKNVARALLDTVQSADSSHTKVNMENITMPQPVLEHHEHEDLPLFNFDGLTHVNDDSWINEFLGVNKVP